MNAAYLPSNTLDTDFMDSYLRLTGREKYEVAHQSKDMFWCTWLHGPHPACDALKHNPKTIFTPRGGICYVFNFQDAEAKHKLVSNIEGAGLAIDIDIESKIK